MVWLPQLFFLLKQLFKVYFYKPKRIISHAKLGVGGTVHILGDGLKSMASQFLSKNIVINELNPKIYRF